MDVRNKRPASALAAMGLLAAVIAAGLQESPVSAQQASGETQPGSGGYLGWVHRTDDDGKTSSTVHWNTRTGAIANTSGAGRTLKATLRDPTRNENSDYDASTGIIRTNDLSPAESRALPSIFPLAYDDLLGELQSAMGKDGVKVVHTTERGLDRYDFTLTFPPVVHFADITARDRWLPLHTISSAWADPKSGLLTKITGGGTSVALTYGAPEIHSIHDLGAPRDAKVVSNRPTAAAIAVYDRMQANLRKPTPDGILVEALTGGTYGEITLYYQHGVDWAMRNYRVSMPGPNGAEGVALPPNWQTTGAEEFFRRLAVAMPESERSGDDKIGWQNAFDPKTGDVFLSWSAEWEDENGISRSMQGRDPGPAKLTKDEILGLHTLNGPTSWAFPRAALGGRYGLDNHFEIATSDEHPGLLGVRTRYERDPPTDVPLFVNEAWIDPAHNDRTVTITSTAYKDSPDREIEHKTVQEFSDFGNFPAPDGRSYPRLCKQTSYKTDNTGKLAVGNQSETAAQFFPNHALPEVPKNPATLPVSAPGDLP